MFVSPDLDVEDVGQEFISVRTKGDGGCALHAVWGTPTLEQGLALAGGQLHGRNQCCDMLADSWDAAKTQVGNWEVLEQVSLALWSELAEPGAQGEDDVEAGLFWKNLRGMNPGLAEQVLLFLEQKRYDVQN